MVGTRRLELLTSTVSILQRLTSAWRLPKYTQVVQDIAFCGSDCGLKNWVHLVPTNAICTSSNDRTHRAGRPPDARSHTLSPVYTSPEEGKCEHATNEDIFGLATAR